MGKRNSQSLLVSCGDLAGRLGYRSIKEPIDTKVRRVMLLLLVAIVLAGLSVTSRPQSLIDPGDSSGTKASTAAPQLDLAALRQTQIIMARNYVLDAYGPYPIVGAAFTDGINQLRNSPLEWNQGIDGYSKRYGSDLGIAAVGTTTRYGLAEAFKEYTLNYRCECNGVFPGLSHAAISTLSAHLGEDSHRVCSFLALVAPNAGSRTAVYAWYPNRYGAEDAFRMGNYSMLAYVGENISLEFVYSGPHSLLYRMHLNNAHGSPDQGPNK
jgi:hypothetical protein